MDKKLASLITIFFLSFAVFASVVVFNKPLSKLIRASQEVNASPVNSLILAFPLSLKADGQSQSTITVFLRNEQNYPVPNKPVSITASLGQIKESEVTTSKDGKAEFHLLSTTPGLANVIARTGNLEITQKISVKFE